MKASEVLKSIQSEFDSRVRRLNQLIQEADWLVELGKKDEAEIEFLQTIITAGDRELTPEEMDQLNIAPPPSLEEIKNYVR